MKLIWHYDPAKLVEVDWLHYLLGDLIDEEIIDLDLVRHDDNSIHVVSNLRGPLSIYQSYFEECRSRCRHIVLLHLSDEYFSGGYQMYRYFDLVIRWNHTCLASGRGIITIPLGYQNNTGHSNLPADQRQYAWSFVGEIKSSRIAMAKAFESFKPQFITGTDAISKANPKRLCRTEFDAVLQNTVFAPCPMGNATIDTNRIYESLELGCIPIVELRPTLDFYTNQLGKNPLPAFRTWPEARRFAEAIFNDKAALLQLQATIASWWLNYKVELRTQLLNALRNDLSFAPDLQKFAAKLPNRLSGIYAPLRIGEILRHQTVDSLLRRVSRPSGPVKRIITEMIQRT